MISHLGCKLNWEIFTMLIKESIVKTPKANFNTFFVSLQTVRWKIYTIYYNFLWLGLRLSNLILKFNTQIDVIGTYISHTNQVIYPIWTIILNSCQNFGQKIGHFQPREIKMIDCMHVLSIDLLKIICKMLLKWEPSFCLIKVTTFSFSKKYRPGNFIGQYACNCMLISYLTPLFVSGQTCRCACRYMTCIHVHKVLRYSWTQTPKTQSRPKIYTCIQVICDFF